ncbi:CD99 molecule isoform X1 [Takifugu flavidus]|uniref:CD99 molecule isoform X1 n=1 Tax=Takifugu flavidus TaxID=433684 RepID=UPI002544B1FA|nr:CD99 molecule isoform X1 [Takifugu flavidus]
MKFPLEVLSLLLLVAGTLTQDLDLADFFDNDAPTEKPKVTQKPKTDGNFDLNLEDALNPDPKPDKPPVAPPKPGGAGGTFGDADLFEVGKGDYKPEGGRSGGAGNAGHDTQGGADQPQEASAGPLAGIISAIGVAVVGAASSYFAYQKKKLCFKIQGGEDPERGKEQQGQPDPQVYSNLLKTS